MARGSTRVAESSRIAANAWGPLVVSFWRGTVGSRLPPEFYQIGTPGNLRWDNIGLKAVARDWAAWPGSPSEDLMLRSQFNLFRDIGAHLYGRSSDALRFAMDRIAIAEPISSQPVDPQLPLALEKRACVEGKNINP